MDEKFWHLKNCDLFGRLTPEQIDRLESVSRARTFERGSLIYLPSDAGDALLMPMSGRVKLYHITSDGKQALLGLIEPGELFGELSLIESGEREEFAEAMVKSRILLIPRVEVQKLMEEVPAVTLQVTQLIGLRRRKIERRLKSLLFRSNRERLIFLLLELVEKYGKPNDDGVELDIRLSHQEMANIIGSTRETVTVLLGELQLDRSIRVARRRITVMKIGPLAEEIGVASPSAPVGARVGNRLRPQPTEH